MTTWKLTIKPESESESDAFEFCKNNSLLGVGWAHAYESDQPEDIDQAKELVEGKYEEWPDPIKYLLEDVKAGDHIWIHKDGKYYLCKAKDKILFGRQIDDKFLKYDLGHAREAQWVEIPEIYVSGTIQRGTIARKIIQRIRITDKEQNFHEFLFTNLSKDPKWRVKFDDSAFEKKVSSVTIEDLFNLMSPDDFEDVVAAYLQDKGWILVKSTCFKNKPVFEFSMVNKKHEVGYVQVKSGRSPNPLPPSNYEKYISNNTLVFLFSTHPTPYPGELVNGVKPISHDEMFSWIKENAWALPTSLKARLWYFLIDS